MTRPPTEMELRIREILIRYFDGPYQGLIDAPAQIIRAMREPTDEMLLAGEAAPRSVAIPQGHSDKAVQGRKHIVALIYTAAMNAASPEDA